MKCYPVDDHDDLIAALCATRAKLARVHSTHRRLAPCMRGAAKKSAVVIENATVIARALHERCAAGGGRKRPSGGG